MYQHYIVGWLHFEATADDDDKLEIQIEEWNWRTGVQESWDGLIFSECKLLECKLGYLDFIHPDYRGRRAGYQNSPGPWLPTLETTFGPQLIRQWAAVAPDKDEVRLEWVFSDQEVMWQFVALRTALALHEVDNRYAPFHLLPSGTAVLRGRFQNGDDGYGYWEDV